MNDAIIKNITDKMYFKFIDNEESNTKEVLTNFITSFNEINKNFTELNQLEPMTHTIDIEKVTLREDNPINSPEIEVLFSNASHLNDREIEVPKVVGE